MSTYTIDKIEYGGDVYRLQDSVSDYITGIDYQDVVDALGYTPTDNVGTVTSITLTQGTGISINSSGVAITNSGSRTISLATITKSDSTSTVSPAHGETFTAIDSITYDTYGRVTGVNTKTITLPADSNTDTLVTQTNTTNNLEYRLLFSANANDNDETDISRKNTYLRYNPNKKALISSGEIRANKGVFNQLVATSANFDSATITDLTAQNATVVGLLDVQGQLHSNSWTNANIANIGGSFYITPTIESASGTISITRNVSNNIVSWSIQIIGTFATDFIKSGIETAGVNWPSGSLVLLTGNIILNDMEYPLGTLQGTLSSQVNADNTGVSKTLTITGIKDSQNSSTNASPVLQRLYELNGNANIIGASFSNGKISLYKLGNYPIGIQMSSMGTNSNSLIEIYGGHSANPNVRIGHLAGLPNVNGSAPTGWGIYTDNGYFTGVIVSTAGKIGNWTIENTTSSSPTYGGALYTGSFGTDNGIFITPSYTSSTSIGGSTGSKNWTLTASNNFGVTTDGTLYAQNAKIMGSITASSFKVEPNATIIDEYGLISNSEIEVGARNLLLNTSEITFCDIELVDNYQAVDCYKLFTEAPLIFEENDLVTISFDWSTTATNGNFCVEAGFIDATTKEVIDEVRGIWGTVINAVGGRSTNSNYIDITSTNNSGHFSITFKITSTQLTTVTPLQWLRIGLSDVLDEGTTFTLSHAKAEKGNKATDWNVAPEDIQNTLDSINQSVESTAITVGDIKTTIVETVGDINELKDSVEDVSTKADDAAKTATNYITPRTVMTPEMDERGIMVHDYFDATTGVRIDTDIEIIRNNKSAVVIDDTGMSIYAINLNDPTDPNNAHAIAHYGASTIIGKETWNHVQINKDELGFYEAGATIADAYLTNNQLFIQKTVTREVAIGEEEIVDSETNNVRFVPKQQWSWKTHKNINGQNNLGLRWGG